MKLLLGILLILLRGTLTSDKLEYTELPTQKQLPAAQISRTFQDKEGYMWYATDGGGLCRDDGYRVDIFRSDFNVPSLLESNWITCITEDHQNRIWFGTKRGLYILDKKDYQIHRLDAENIESWAIDAVLAAADGTVWISANNLVLRYEAATERPLGTYTLKWQNNPRPVTQIYKDKDDKIWVLQWKGSIFGFDSRQNNFVSYPWPFDVSPTCLTQTPVSGKYLISTLGKGIVLFNPDGKDDGTMFSVQSFSVDKDDSRNDILGMYQDTVRHYLWTMTDSNLFAYRISKDDGLYPLQEYENFSSKKVMLNQIMGDGNGNIWVSSFYPHTFILSYSRKKVSRYSISQWKEEVEYPVLPVAFVYDDGAFWFCQRRSGVYLYIPAENGLWDVSQDPGLGGQKISPLLVKAAGGRGVYMVRNDKDIMRVQHGRGGKLMAEEVVRLPAHEKIHTLREDADICLWIGTSTGLFRYDLLSRRLDNPIKEIGIINDIAIQDEDTLFLATEKNGLCLFRSGLGLQSYAKGTNFLTIDIAPDRKVWAGTSHGEVFCFDSDEGQLVDMTGECGLNGDAITALKVDGNGWIWMLANQRIVVYNPVDYSINSIYNSDSFIAMNNFLSLYKDGEGDIFVGGTDGFCSFPSYEANDKMKEVSIKLSSVKIDNVTRPVGYAEKEILLQPDEQSLDLSFSTLDPLNAKKIRYAFRYGKEEAWNYLPEGQNNIYLTGLSKGVYTLEVKATDSNGHWGDNTLKVNVHRLPAWYETTWAYTLYVLFGMCLVYAALHIYMERKKRRLVNEQIQNSAKDLQALVCQLSEEMLTPETTDGLDLKSLLVSIQKILIRQKEKKAGMGSVAEDGNTLSASDEKFIQKALDYIGQNMDNSSYSVELLSRDLGMERTGLYRKLVAIIGKTPTDFIRSARLKRAAILLAEGASVSEAADRVGFGTASYLSRCFQKEYGMKPSEYIASMKTHRNKAGEYNNQPL